MTLRAMVLGLFFSKVDQFDMPSTVGFVREHLPTLGTPVFLNIRLIVVIYSLHKLAGIYKIVLPF